MQAMTHRETKYCTAIKSTMRTLGHATNAQILASLHRDFPELSATTVHRATARLAERGEIGVAPSTVRGAVRYDVYTEPHDHFHCSVCDRLCDADVKDKIQPIIKSSITDCSISGNVVLTGVCNQCA